MDERLPADSRIESRAASAPRFVLGALIEAEEGEGAN